MFRVDKLLKWKENIPANHFPSFVVLLESLDCSSTSEN